MKRISLLFCALFAMGMSPITVAGSGQFFNVTATGAPANLSLTLCLNGAGPFSCQNYTVSALNLSISTTIPNHVYPSVGIKVNTPNYALAGCTPTPNGYCLFSASSTTSTSIAASSTTEFSVGGTLSGLSGTVILQNNGTNSTSISTDGNFTFSTPVTKGSTYNVTVLTQPENQTCSVANGSGTMGSANVSNVTVTCSTNTFTVGGSVSGLSGTVTLQNNGINSTPISSNGSFTFSTPVAQGSTYNVTVLTQPLAQTCTVTNGSGTIGSSNITNVSVSCVTNNTTLTVSLTGTIPVNGASGSLMVTNTGTIYTAYNVAAMLPGGWTGVTQDATGCTAISPNGGTCTLTFTSTAPYVAQGSITVTGDNITSPPTTALAFTVNSYLVWAVSGSTVQVIDTNNLPSFQWGNGVITSATSKTDGLANTSIIKNTGGIGASAAVNCYNSTNGGAAAGDWYLPAICQMGGAGQAGNCSAGLANISTNLVRFGFGGLSGKYWSSTQFSGSNDVAWSQTFVAAGGSQNTDLQHEALGVRCSRALTF